MLVGHQHHHKIGALDGVGDLGHLQPRLLDLVPRGTALAHPNRDLDTRIVKVQRMRVTLTAVADYADLLAFDQRQVGIFFVIDFHVPALSSVGAVCK
jgi:hypothetical protein